jgi:hypothetical protein
MRELDMQVVARPGQTPASVRSLFLAIAKSPNELAREVLGAMIRRSRTSRILLEHST